MIFTQSKEERWKLFEHYSTRMLLTMSRDPSSQEFALNQEEYKDFLYLKLYFSEDYLLAKQKPWLPSFFTKLKNKK